MRSDPSGTDMLSATLRELLHRSNIALDNPPVEVTSAEILGSVNVELSGLPRIVFAGLPGAGNLYIELLDAETVLAGYREAAAASIRADPAESGGVIGEGKLQPVDVGRHGNVIAIGMLVHQDTGVISGHDDIA